MEPSIALHDPLDLRQVVTTGSVLHINEDYNGEPTESEKEMNEIDILGEPVTCFKDYASQLTNVDEHGFIKKRIIEEGGGQGVDTSCTVTIIYSGYWENDPTPFDVRPRQKPLTVDLNDHGLLPGLYQAVKSMLVGELSLFLISYKLMYGELGIPPRIKPKSDCIFYIKLVRSIITPKEGEIVYTLPNMFYKVEEKVKKLYVSAAVMHKAKNYPAAIQLFRKGIGMLHRSRLADDVEEKRQEKLLIKGYINLAICYNKNKMPLRACTACNETNRLTNIWSNPKVLFQNAKALRMIGDFDSAEKRLLRAMKLKPKCPEMEAELKLLYQTRDLCNQNKLNMEKVVKDESLEAKFKKEVDILIRNFKENENLCKLTLPTGLSPSEMDYVREVCLRENLFCNKLKDVFALDRTDAACSPEDLAEDMKDIFL